MKTPFSEAIPVIEKLKENGYEAYFVGGSVRDLLLNREIGDIDITTSAKPDEIQEMFPKTVDVGAEHGTIIVLHNGKPYEVTTYRAESGYDDFRRPNKVNFINCLREDLKRRDFTINAMAMDSNGEIIDYFDGKQHLEENIIRTVGDPGERFNEDALRMLRALRFSSQLQFRLADEVKEAITDHAKLLDNISIERKTVEFEKLLRGKNSKYAIALLMETGTYTYLPCFASKEKELHCLQKLDLSVLSSSEELWTLITYILRNVEIESFLRSWKLPTKIIKAAGKNNKLLEQLQANDWTKFLLYSAGLKSALEVEKIRLMMNGHNSISNKLAELTEMFHRLPMKSRDELVITGRDILEIISKQAGPWVAELLQEIEMLIVDGRLKNDEREIKEWLYNWKLEFGQNY
ncbi:CCA tRNA nucleotidyltransferase [Metabacillus fastidiosus]|uniref:CCA tRNA nucleotidyltransferase n=1 Tax=Metabacillus fastidiosus TaxID=1458 RepID=UPI003D2AFB7D